jgi:phosphoribosylformimino-5-aminoimidazole carboxamide ribotide isomerase
MLVIPAVDIRGGKCVRLRQGKAAEETVFGDDPVEMARHWEREGAEYLHVVDLDGAFDGTPKNLKIVKRIIRAVDIRVEVGGGIREDAVVEELFAVGADRVIIGTKAIESFDWVRRVVGKHPNGVAIGIDVKEGFVATHGWVEKSAVAPSDLLELFRDYPVAAYIYTDILRDGTKTGPNVAATKLFAAETTTPVIASGGVSCLDDLHELAAAGIEGTIVGRALYDRRFISRLCSAILRAPSVAS